MTVFTKSQWYYGHTVAINNRLIDFSRSSVVYQGEVAVGAYTLTNYAQALVRAMNIADPGNTYIATLNRATREITISGTNNFEILGATGAGLGASTLALAGFTTDRTGANSYTGSASGSVFIPQLKLQDYTPFDLDQDAADSVINQSASGRIESVSFGRNRFMTCNIRYQNNNKARFTGLSNGLDDLKAFLLYATTKSDLEFMPDIDTPNNFVSCVLESTTRSSKGTGFRIIESDGIPGFYDSGRLVFRERT